MNDNNKDVHTEHCCIFHGCKYGMDKDCTVVQEIAVQDFPCEECSLNEENGYNPYWVNPNKDYPYWVNPKESTPHKENFEQHKDYPTGMECKVVRERNGMKENKFEKIGREIGKIVGEKNAAYGNSFGRAGDCLKQMYPDGIRPDQYESLLTITRVLDKLFRIAKDEDAFGESPWMDIAGYSILAVNNKSPKPEEAAHLLTEQQPNDPFYNS